MAAQTKMSTDCGCCDIACDMTSMILEEQAKMHDALMAESRGNASGSHSILRYAASRKYNETDPMEAAAAEMVLQPNV